MALPGLVAANNLSDVVDREKAWDNLGLNMSADYFTLPLGIAPGTPFGGGFFAGFISHTADGNPTHALIVAPRATGATGTGYTLTTDLTWKTANTPTVTANSSFDGVSNTSALVADGIDNYPAAKFCTELNINGFADWYLPARFELDIAYFNLKPTTALNTIDWGVNDYAVPRRTVNYTADDPAQTTIDLFKTTAERFSAITHWSSEQSSPAAAFRFSFIQGLQGANNKTTLFAVRAFRRITL
jgi:hypothetical protein